MAGTASVVDELLDVEPSVVAPPPAPLEEARREVTALAESPWERLALPRPALRPMPALVLPAALLLASAAWVAVVAASPALLLVLGVEQALASDVVSYPYPVTWAAALGCFSCAAVAVVGSAGVALLGLFQRRGPARPARWAAAAHVGSTVVFLGFTLLVGLAGPAWVVAYFLPGVPFLAFSYAVASLFFAACMLPPALLSVAFALAGGALQPAWGFRQPVEVDE